MHSQYNSKGFEVLAFPFEMFKTKEPGQIVTQDEIEDFMREKFKAEFPIYEKVRTVGDDAHPLFTRLSEASELTQKQRKEPFCKFLLDTKTLEVQYFDFRFNPEKMKDHIEALL